MKHPHWTWEAAYKKWFFLRFFLLLVVLGLSIALLCITRCNQKYDVAGTGKNTYTHKQTKNLIEGEYANVTRPEASIKLIHVSDNDYALYGFAINASAHQESPNTGELSGLVSIKDNQGFYKNGMCEISLNFRSDALIVEDRDDGCGGAGVTFSGEYKHIK
jgi:hypothetical protein